jgi:hypothetical protein
MILFSLKDYGTDNTGTHWFSLSQAPARQDDALHDRPLVRLSEPLLARPRTT